MKKLVQNTSLVAAGLVVGVAVAPPAVQAAINYFDVTKVVSGSGSVSCPSGWKLTGGGVAQLPSDRFSSTYSDEYKLTGSWPYSSRTWKATATKVHGTNYGSTGWRFTTSGYYPRVYAVCAN
jgi:hypothetical protein